MLVAEQSYQEAEKTLREGIGRTHDSRLKFRLASTLIEQERFEEAHGVLELLLREAPNMPDPYLGLCDLARHSQKWEEARGWALKALERNSPSYFWTKYEVGRRLAEIPGGHDDAVDLLTQFSSERPREPLPHMMLAALLETTDAAAATRHLEVARALYGDNDAFEADARLIRERLT